MSIPVIRASAFGARALHQTTPPARPCQLPRAARAAARCPLVPGLDRRYTRRTSHDAHAQTGEHGRRMGVRRFVRSRERAVGGRCMIATDAMVRSVLRDEALTRGLGDIEARMLMEWLANWTELLADAARNEDDAW